METIKKVKLGELDAVEITRTIENKLVTTKKQLEKTKQELQEQIADIDRFLAAFD